MSKARTRTNPTRWIAAVALLAYAVVLVRVIVFKAIPTLRIGHVRFRFGGTHTGPPNFVPFRTIGPQLHSHGNRLIAMVNLLGNILPFVPVGILAPMVFRRMTWRSALVLSLSTGLFMELTEAVFRVGIFDVDDILLNALGVMLGYCLFAVFA